MANSGVIVLKTKDQIVPKEQILEFLDKHKSSVGVCATTDKKEIQIIGLAEAGNVDNIMQMQEQLKEFGMLLHFGNYGGPIGMEEVQPYATLWDKDNNPILAVTVDGDFSEFTTDKHSGEYHVVHDEIIPKFNNIYKLVGGDFAKFQEQLKNEQLTKELLRLGKGHDCTISIFSVDGSIKTLSHGEQFRTKKPWGWFTNRWIGLHKEADKPAEEPKKDDKPAEPAATPAQTSKRLSFGGAKADATPSPAPDTTKPADASEPPTSPDVPVTGDDLIIVGPPPEGLSNKQRLAFWKNAGITPPKDFKHGTVTLDRKAIKDLKALGTAWKVFHPAKADAVKETVTPVLSAETKQRVGAILKQATDSSSAVVGDPEKLKASEAKSPSFSEQFGVDFDKAVFWSYTDLVALGKESPEALALFAKELRDFYIDLADTTEAAPKKEEPAPQSKRLQLGGHKAA